MFNFLLIYNVIFMLGVLITNGQIPKKRLCANPDCSEPISEGTTKLSYGSIDKRKLSFKPNEKVTIYSKSEAGGEQLWGAEIRGKRGYVPSSFIRELKIFKEVLQHEVNGEGNEAASAAEALSKIKKVSPDPVQQPFQVIEGTTFLVGATESSLVINQVEQREGDPSRKRTESLDESKQNVNSQKEVENPKEEIKLGSNLNKIENDSMNEVMEDDDDEEVEDEEEIDVDDDYEEDDGETENDEINNGKIVNENGNKAVSEVLKLKNTSVSLQPQSIDQGKDLKGDESMKVPEGNLQQPVETISTPPPQAEEVPKVDPQSIPAKTEVPKADSQSISAKTVTEDILATSNSIVNFLSSPTADAQIVKESLFTSKTPENNLQQPVETVSTPPPQAEEVPKADPQSNPAKTVTADVLATSNSIVNFSSSPTADDQIVKESLFTSKTPEDNLQQPVETVSTPPPQAEEVPKADPQLNPAKTVTEDVLATPNSIVNFSSSPTADDQIVKESLFTSKTPEDNLQQPVETVSTPPPQAEKGPKADPQLIPAKTVTEDVLATSSSIVNFSSSPTADDQSVKESLFTSKTPETILSPPLSTMETEINNLFETVGVKGQIVEGLEENVLKEEQVQTPKAETKDTKLSTNNLMQTSPLGVTIEEAKSTKNSIAHMETKEDISATSNRLDDKSLRTDESIETANFLGSLSDQPQATVDNSPEAIVKQVEEITDQLPVGNEAVHQIDTEDILQANQESGFLSNMYTSLFGAFSSEDNSSGDVNGEQQEASNNPESAEKKIEDIARNQPDFSQQTRIETHHHDFESLFSHQTKDEESCEVNPSMINCIDNHLKPELNTASFSFDFPPIAYEVLSVLIIAGITIVVFLWGHLYIEKSRYERPLIAKVNELQKQSLISQKENELLTERIQQLQEDQFENVESISNEVVESLKSELMEAHSAKASLEELVMTLEKELESSTEVGLELNKMLSNILSSENGSEMLVANIEQLQRQLIDQQDTINTYNENLSAKETENHELKLELEIGNTKVIDLQTELNKLALNLLKIEEEKELSQSNHEAEISSLKEKLNSNSESLKGEIKKLSDELRIFKLNYEEAQRELSIRTNEYALLKESFNQVEKMKNNDETLKSLLDVSSIKAELIQLRKDNEMLAQHLRQEVETKEGLKKQLEIWIQDVELIKGKYEEADKEKLEAQTKLEVLSNYFKEREALLQKELNKQESMWIEKQGEATSTIERIKYMQEELQNYKAQNESLMQEIVEQEVQLKSQISVLEKRAHENWVSARQAERRLEDAKHEATQLRNRITLRERNVMEDKMQNRLQSPLEQNGDVHLTNETPASPLLYGARDHITKSPPLPPGLPFLPPPPGVPFMPPPIGSSVMPLPPGFLPPPPSMLPGDHRPPPLGRMSSPPLNSFSPEARPYSPYSRNSPSPTSDDEYDRSSPLPPVYRGYSPYNRGDERLDYNRPPPPPRKPIKRNNKDIALSSGSENSNESLEKINRHNSMV